MIGSVYAMHIYPHGDRQNSRSGAWDVLYAEILSDGRRGRWMTLADWRGTQEPLHVHDTPQAALFALLRERLPMTDDSPWIVRRTDKGGLTIRDRQTGEMIYASDPPGACPMHPIHARQIEEAMKAYADPARR